MCTEKRVWVAATLDTKGDEADYVCGLLEAAGVPVALVDLSTSGNLKPQFLALRPGVFKSPRQRSRRTIRKARVPFSLKIAGLRLPR